MAYPVPKYGIAAGSHVWQSRGVHAKGAHMETSCPLASSSYRSVEFLQLHFMTIFFGLMQLLFLLPHLLSYQPWNGKTSWQPNLLLFICKMVNITTNIMNFVAMHANN